MAAPNARHDTESQGTNELIRVAQILLEGVDGQQCLILFRLEMYGSIHQLGCHTIMSYEGHVCDQMTGSVCDNS